MKWEYWITLYLDTYCPAQGLQPKTIAAYAGTLRMFRAYITTRLENKDPDEVVTRDVLEYVDFLRRERKNGDAAVNRQATVVKNFYRAMVAMNQLEYRRNPMVQFPKIRGVHRKIADTLNEEEVARLIDAPDTDTVLGLRDRALLVLLYGTGIRASECSGIDDEDLDLSARTVRVLGKGGHQRTVPLKEEVVRILAQYRLVRWTVKTGAGFFQSRRGGRLSRNAIYERVRKYAREARIHKKVSPHRLRHTFATHMIRAGVNPQVLKDLLGHRLITSTQIYLHMTAEDLREAAELHPIGRLIGKVADLLPDLKLPFQKTHLQRRA